MPKKLIYEKKCPRRRASRVPPLQGRSGLQVTRSARLKVVFACVGVYALCAGPNSLVSKVNEETTVKTNLPLTGRSGLQV